MDGIQKQHHDSPSWDPASTMENGQQTPAVDCKNLKAEPQEQTPMSVPEEMMTDEECLLCEIKFVCLDMANQHYGGRKHGQKEEQFVRKTANEHNLAYYVMPSSRVFAANCRTDGNNNTDNSNGKLQQKDGLMVAAKTEEQKQENEGKPIEEVKQERNPVYLDKFHLSCFLCGFLFENYDDLERHVKTPMHAVRIWEYQLQGSQDFTYNASARLMNLRGNWPKDFRCKLCDKMLSSAIQFQQHLLSRIHNLKEKNLYEHGDPRGNKNINNSNNTNSNVQSTGGGIGGQQWFSGGGGHQQVNRSLSGPGDNNWSGGAGGVAPVVTGSNRVHQAGGFAPRWNGGGSGQPTKQQSPVPSSPASMVSPSPSAADLAKRPRWGVSPALTGQEAGSKQQSSMNGSGIENPEMEGVVA